MFKLEHASHAESFQRVLTRTLRLDKLRSSEVKDYLLAIFRRDLPDSTIDFKAEWEKAFSEVNADRAQYLAAFRQQASIGGLERQQLRRLELRGKLLHFRPLIDERLQAWETHFTAQGDALRNAMTSKSNAAPMTNHLLGKSPDAARQRSATQARADPSFPCGRREQAKAGGRGQGGDRQAQEQWPERSQGRPLVRLVPQIYVSALAQRISPG